MLICEPSQLGTAFGSHSCSFPAVLLCHVLEMLDHCGRRLPLLVHHFTDDLHMWHFWARRRAGGLPYANGLYLSYVTSLLAFVQRILVSAELRDFRCVPKLD